eukprot:101925-Chlamydomonas_euryale.AAC.1
MSATHALKRLGLNWRSSCAEHTSSSQHTALWLSGLGLRALFLDGVGRGQRQSKVLCMTCYDGRLRVSNMRHARFWAH